MSVVKSSSAGRAPWWPPTAGRAAPRSHSRPHDCGGTGGRRIGNPVGTLMAQPHDRVLLLLPCVVSQSVGLPCAGIGLSRSLSLRVPKACRSVLARRGWIHIQFRTSAGWPATSASADLYSRAPNGRAGANDVNDRSHNGAQLQEATPLADRYARLRRLHFLEGMKLGRSAFPPLYRGPPR